MAYKDGWRTPSPSPIWKPQGNTKTTWHVCYDTRGYLPPPPPAILEKFSPWLCLWLSCVWTLLWFMRYSVADSYSSNSFYYFFFFYWILIYICQSRDMWIQARFVYFNMFMLGISPNRSIVQVDSYPIKNEIQTRFDLIFHNITWMKR